MTLKGAQSRRKVGSKGWPGRQVRGDRVAPWSVGEYAPAPGRRRPENRDNSQEIGILEPARTSSLFGYSRSREMVSEGEHAFPRAVRVPLPPGVGGAQPGRGAGTREARQPHAPLVCRSASSRNWASFWILCSLPCFPIPRSRRVVRESRRMSFQVGPSLKIIPKEEGAAEQLLPPRRAGARGRQRGARDRTRSHAGSLPTSACGSCPRRAYTHPLGSPLVHSSNSLSLLFHIACSPRVKLNYASHVFPVC